MGSPALAASGDLTLASTSDSGTKGNSISYAASLSADGTKVAFQSAATNLDDGDTDAFNDIYVKDLTTGTVTLASTSDTDVKGNGHTYGSSLSADGTKVAFYSNASNLGEGDTDANSDIYVKDLTTGALTLASTSDTGLKANNGGVRPSLSADGTAVAFYSS